MRRLAVAGPGLGEVEAGLQGLLQVLTACCAASRGLVSLQQSQQTGLCLYLASLLAALARLQTAVCDCLAGDLLLLDTAQQSHLPALLELLQLEWRLGTGAGQAGLEILLTTFTSRLLPSVLAAFMRLEVALPGPALLSSIQQLNRAVRCGEQELATARATRQFWEASGPRLAGWRIPSRRLVLDSRQQHASLLGHLTRHHLVLLSDCLLDIGYTVTEHPLATVWLEASPARPELTLTTPETALSLGCPDPAGRQVWAAALQRCILSSLGRAGWSGAAAPVARTARYSWRGAGARTCYTGKNIPFKQ